MVIARFILAVVAAFLTVTLAGAFVEWEANPGNWNPGTRVLGMFFIPFLVMVFSMMPKLPRDF